MRDTMANIYIYCTLRGRIKGAASAVSVIQHGLGGGARNTARHVITVTVLAFPYTRNKAGKMLSTINQLSTEGTCCTCNNGTRSVVSIDHTALGVRLMLYGYLDHTPRTIIARTALPSVL